MTVIAPDAMTADGLASAVSVMGRQKGLGLVDSLDETEVIVVPAGKNVELIHTEGIRRFVDPSQKVPVYSSASIVAGQGEP